MQPPSDPSNNPYNEPTYPSFNPMAPPPPPPRRSFRRWWNARRRRTKIILLCVAAFLFISMVNGIASGGQGIGSQAALVPTDTPDTISTQIAQDSTTVAQDATAIATIAPDNPTPTLVPTRAVAPTPVPKANPCPNAPFQNPWCYDFTPGHLIFNPPADFCSVFPCIASFDSGTGFVNECQDGQYSKSGGHTGDCSRHGGEKRPLYSH